MLALRCEHADFVTELCFNSELAVDRGTDPRSIASRHIVTSFPGVRSSTTSTVRRCIDQSSPQRIVVNVGDLLMDVGFGSQDCDHSLRRAARTDR